VNRLRSILAPTLVVLVMAALLCAGKHCALAVVTTTAGMGCCAVQEKASHCPMDTDGQPGMECCKPTPLSNAQTAVVAPAFSASETGSWELPDFLLKLQVPVAQKKQTGLDPPDGSSFFIEVVLHKALGSHAPPVV